MISGSRDPSKRIIDFGDPDQKAVRDNMNRLFNKVQDADDVKVFETLISKNREKITQMKDVNDIAVLLFQEYRKFRINEVLNAAELEPTDQLKYVGVRMIDSFHSLVPLKILSGVLKSELTDRIPSNYRIRLHEIRELEKWEDVF